MKLTNKKKEAIKDVIRKAMYMVSNNIKKELYEKLLNIIETSEKRSLPELHLYWLFCGYIAENMPEMILRMLDMQSMSDKATHELFKCKMEVTSVAFSNMQESDFNMYFNKVKGWAADYLMRCDVVDLEEEFKNYIDRRK